MPEHQQQKRKLSPLVIRGIIFFLLGLTLILVVFFLYNYLLEQERERKEVFAIQEIAAEIQYYQFIQSSGSKKMTDVLEASERLLDQIRNPQNRASDADILLDLHKLTWLFLAGTPTTKYSTLNASGHFEYIQSPALRHSLLQFHADVEKLVQFESIQVRYVDLVLRPFLNQHMDRSSMEANTLVPRLDSVIIQKYPSPFQNNLDELLRNREFANLLVDLKFHTRRLMYPFGRIGMGIKHINDIISKEYPKIKPKPYTPF